MNSQKKYWDTVGYNKEFTHPIDFQVFEKLVHIDAMILDYGCGYGRVLQELHKKNYKNLYGIDYSNSLIERGKILYPHLNLELNESSHTGFDEDSFDVVLLFAVLTCNPTVEQQTKIIKEIYRILKPGGIIYISDYLLQSDERNITRYQKDENKYGRYGVFDIEEGVTMKHHNKKDIDALLSRFSQRSYKELEVRTMNHNISLAFQYVGEKDAK